jgi:hypothetical protein
LRFILDTAGHLEAQYQIDLLPALVVLAGVFTFQQYKKRQEAKAEARGAANGGATRSRAGG